MAKRRCKQDMHERRGGGQADYLQVDASLPMATAQKMRI